MAIPLYDGWPVFGPAPTVVGKVNPVARVTRGFAGANGLMTKVLGSRGASADATGVLLGPTEADVMAQVTLFENLKLDGTPRTLLDSRGVTWPQMILVEFDPGAAHQDQQGYACEYTGRFLGLAVPAY